jgi:integrase
MPRQKQPPRIERARNGFYYAIWYDEAASRTKRESMGTKEEAEAIRRFALWLTQEAEEEIASANLSQVIEFYDREMIEPHIVSKVPRRAALRHIIRHCGDDPASSIDFKWVRRYIDKRSAEGAKSGTIRQELLSCYAALRLAAQRGFGGVSAPAPFELPPKSPPKEDWLSADQIEAAFAYCQHFRPAEGILSASEIFCHLALRTAARRDAIFELEWSRVDLKRRLIDYRTRAWLSLPKKRQSKKRALLPISDKLFEVLKLAFEQRIDEFVVPRKKIGEIVCIRRQLYYLGKAIPGATPHAFRRTYATMASMAGIDMTTISRVLANSAAVTEARYARFSPDYLKRAIEIDL